MLLGLIVAYVAVPPDAFGSWGPGAGWAVGLVAALVAVIGYFTWYPPSGLAGPPPAVISKEEEGESSRAEPEARDRPRAGQTVEPDDTPPRNP